MNLHNSRVGELQVRRFLSWHDKVFRAQIFDSAKRAVAQLDQGPAGEVQECVVTVLGRPTSEKNIDLKVSEKS